MRRQNNGQITRKNKNRYYNAKSLCSIRTIPIPKSLLNILLSYKTSAIGYLLTNSEMKYIKMY